MKNETSNSLTRDFIKFHKVIEHIKDDDDYNPFPQSSMSHDVFMGLNDKEKFALEVVHRHHRCNVLLHLISTLRQQRDYEKKEFKLRKDTSNGIGVSCSMTCKTCGKPYDITDYSVW